MYRAIATILMLVVFTSCSEKGFRKISSDEDYIIDAKVFPQKFNKVVYDSEFNFYGRVITGLTIIKKTDSSYRFVSMSELGIKYFDIEFFQNKFLAPKVHYIMDVLNKKPLIKRLTGDLSILFINPGNGEKIKLNENSVDILSNGYIYGVTSSEIREIKIKKCLGSSKPLYMIDYNEKQFPSKVEIERAKFKISLIEIRK